MGMEQTEAAINQEIRCIPINSKTSMLEPTTTMMVTICTTPEDTVDTTMVMVKVTMTISKTSLLENITIKNSMPESSAARPWTPASWKLWNVLENNGLHHQDRVFSKIQLRAIHDLSMNIYAIILLS